MPEITKHKKLLEIISAIAGIVLTFTCGFLFRIGINIYPILELNIPFFAQQNLENL